MYLDELTALRGQRGLRTADDCDSRSWLQERAPFYVL